MHARMHRFAHNNAYSTSNCALSPVLASRKIRNRRSTSFVTGFYFLGILFQLTIHSLRDLLATFADIELFYARYIET